MRIYAEDVAGGGFKLGAFGASYGRARYLQVIEIIEIRTLEHRVGQSRYRKWSLLTQLGSESMKA